LKIRISITAQSFVFVQRALIAAPPPALLGRSKVAIATSFAHRSSTGQAGHIRGLFADRRPLTPEAHGISAAQLRADETIACAQIGGKQR
jgi:hypothetical protein